MIEASKIDSGFGGVQMRRPTVDGGSGGQRRRDDECAERGSAGSFRSKTPREKRTREAKTALPSGGKKQIWRKISVAESANIFLFAGKINYTCRAEINKFGQSL